MKAETKQFIETHINLIENNGIASAYLDCPLRILNDFNNTLHVAGIYYPAEINTYVVICCYISTMFKDAILKRYDFDYGTEREEYEFDCDFYKYYVDQLNRDLSTLLPKRTLEVTVAERNRSSGHCRLSIRITVD